jgi:hypothetical protein
MIVLSRYGVIAETIVSNLADAPLIVHSLSNDDCFLCDILRLPTVLLSGSNPPNEPVSIDKRRREWLYSRIEAAEGRDGLSGPRLARQAEGEAVWLVDVRDKLAFDCIWRGVGIES